MLTLLALLSRPAPACGGLFHVPSELAEVNTQEAILAQGDGFTQIDYRVAYEGDAKSFGWVLPVPGTVQSVSDGSLAYFDDIRAATDPEEDLKEAKSVGCLLGGASKGDVSDTAGSRGVTVISQGFTGTYGYIVLEADSTGPLVEWLAEHGWEAGAAAGVIESYVTDGGFQWVAIDAASDQGFRSEDLPPISIRYSGTALLYPARMARWSSESDLHTIVYVKGDQRATLGAGWGEEELPVIWREDGDPDHLRYKTWADKLEQAGRNGKFAVIFSGEVAGEWVTRFETIAPPEALASDAAFALDGGQEEMRTLISNRGCNAPDAAWILLLPAGWTLGRRVRRRGDAPERMSDE